MGQGEAFSILSALAWAYGVILYKRLGDTFPPMALNLLKNGLVLVMLVPVLLAVEGIAWPGIDATSIGISLLSGLLGIAVADTLYFKALNTLGAGRMGIVGNLFSPFVILLSFVFLGERLTAQQVGGFALVSVGVLIISNAPLIGASSTAMDLDARALRRGVLYGVVAVLLMAGAIVMVKRVLESWPLLWISMLRLIGGLIGLVALFAYRGERAPLGHLLPPREHWRALVLAAFVGQMLSMVLWLAGYKYTSASVAAILNETASIFIVLLAWLLLKEPMTRRRVAGVACTISGVALMLA